MIWPLRKRRTPAGPGRWQMYGARYFVATFTGTSGADSFTGGADIDSVIGGGGDDSLVGNGATDNMAGNGGADALDGGAGDDRLFAADLKIISASDVPLLDTGSERDVLIGGPGNDELFAGYGDAVDGGPNDDQLYISLLGAPSGVTADFSQATLVIGGGTITSIEKVSWLQGSNFDDNIVLGGSYAAGSYSGGPHAVAYGGAGNDRLVAGYYTDALYGEDGDDILDGRPGGYSPDLDGGAGNDTLYARDGGKAYGGSGDDVIFADSEAYGGSGNDRIELALGYAYIANGDAGDDLISVTNPYNRSSDGYVVRLAGGDGADTITGSSGADIIASGAFLGYPDFLTPAPDMGTERDRLAGGAGADVIAGGYGDDLDGGDGTDRLRLSLGGAPSGVTIDLAAVIGPGPYVIGGGTIRNFETFEHLTGSAFDDVIRVGSQMSQIGIDGGGGNDKITAGSNAVVFDGGAGNDELNGGAGHDNLVGGAGRDFLSGDSGNDTLDGGAGADTLIGGAGNDMITVDSIDDQIVEAVGGGSDIVTANSSWTMAAGQEIETLIAGNLTGSIDLTGNELANVVIGNGNQNFLRGLAGSDTLNGGFGFDTLDGGSGNDLMIGGGGDDIYFVDSQADMIVEDIFGANDTVISSVSYELSEYVEKLTLSEGIAAQSGTGNSSDNMITGNSLANLLSGQGGSDILLGGGGNDSLNGGTGGDLLDGGVGSDQISGGDGHDNLMGGDGADLLNGDAGNDHLFGQSANGGADGADTLSGGDGADYLQGNAGNDMLDGGEGSDRINGGADEDVLAGGGGNDTVNGNRGNDRIDGGDGDDSLRGGQGSDSLMGGSGDDILSGDLGADTLSGGSGVDFFLFNGNAALLDNAGVGADVVADFQDGIDRLYVGYAVSAVLSGSAQASVASARLAAQLAFEGREGTGEVAVFRVGGDAYLFYSSNGGGTADSAVQLVGINPSAISLTDFG